MLLKTINDFSYTYGCKVQVILSGVAEPRILLDFGSRDYIFVYIHANWSEDEIMEAIYAELKKHKIRNNRN